jgi:hypothetical protein
LYRYCKRNAETSKTSPYAASQKKAFAVGEASNNFFANLPNRYLEIQASKVAEEMNAIHDEKLVKEVEVGWGLKVSSYSGLTPQVIVFPRLTLSSNNYLK